MYSEILRYAKTEDEKELLAKEVDLLSASLFKTSEGEFEKVLKSNVRAGVASAIRDTLRSGDVDLGKLLEELQKQIKSLVPMRLSLAFEPSEELLGEMYDYITKDISGIYLVINHDKSIIGGATIEFQGKFHDFSLKEKLNKMNILPK